MVSAVEGCGDGSSTAAKSVARREKRAAREREGDEVGVESATRRVGDEATDLATAMVKW
jgi:hypothetical protein